MDFKIDAPRGFDFRRTLGSHGWSELAPCEYVNDGELRRVLDLGEKEPVTLTINGDRTAVRVSASRKLGKLEAEPEFAWVARDGAGRLLRSPTVYEDLVKSIMTTNCSWSLTRKMVTE